MLGIAFYNVRYSSHLALQEGSSNWVHKTQIHSIQRWRHFGAKISQSVFLLEKRLHPFLYWIKYSWSGLTHILYYINLSIRWNRSPRNQISLFQHVFYYNLVTLKFDFIAEQGALWLQCWTKIYQRCQMSNHRDSRPLKSNNTSRLCYSQIGLFC